MASCLFIPRKLDRSHHGSLFRKFVSQKTVRSVSKGMVKEFHKYSSKSFKENREQIIQERNFITHYRCDLTFPPFHGQYAIVVRAENLITAQIVAVKIIWKDKISNKKGGKKCIGEDVSTEVLALKKLANQPNIVKLYNAYEDELSFYVVMELCTGGNLLEKMNKIGPMKEEQAGPLLRQMLIVTRICHSLGIAHRDLKPENFVFKSDREDSPLNMVDFGSAAFFKCGETHPFKGVVGTFSYMAPEVYDSSYGSSIDVWSLGIIAYAMLCHSLPFTANSHEELVEKIKTQEIGFSLSIWEQVSDNAKDLLKKMLEKNPALRITTTDALAHPWLKQWDLQTAQLASRQ